MPVGAKFMRIYIEATKQINTKNISSKCLHRNKQRLSDGQYKQNRRLSIDGEFCVRQIFSDTSELKISVKIRWK